MRVRVARQGSPCLGGVNQTPYHYGSHYSSAGGVLHYLVRMEPFTQLFLDFQGGSLDVADRTFHNVGRSWAMSSELANGDVKELIPEFFYLPEFLVNTNGLDFGAMQVRDRDPSCCLFF